MNFWYLYLTLMLHELRNIVIDSHVTLPSDVTMTSSRPRDVTMALVLMEDI